MGIPSYFSYIIKNYSNIIRKFEECERFDYLLMDCNSIIYDCYYEIEEMYKKQKFDISNIETILINNVIKKMLEYIKFISPLKKTYITFDGVVPLAKMEQQRQRRHKSSLNAKMNKEEKLWNTSTITPGTEFMKKLSNEINNKLKGENIITSLVDEKGEGEQKIFQYIRENCFNENILVYGMDADLIMLSILHNKNNNIRVFRESTTNKNETLFMDIKMLVKSIENEIGENREKDYVFMCFLLGNDFLPHIISLNLRTHGLKTILDAYKKVFGKGNDTLIEDVNRINWDNVNKFISELAKNEKQNMINEHKLRDKFDSRKYKTYEELIENIPIINRENEKYISPEEVGWESRYNKVLESDAEEYIKGLEWILKYYTTGKSDWLWVYKSKYAPLLCDLKKIKIEKYKELIEDKSSMVDGNEQLRYVLPNDEYKKMVNDNNIENTNIKEEYKYHYSYSRYFWEAKLEIISKKEGLLQ